MNIKSDLSVLSMLNTRNHYETLHVQLFINYWPGNAARKAVVTIDDSYDFDIRRRIY